VVTQLGGPSPLLYSAGKLDSDMANVHGPNVVRGCRPGQGRQAELAINGVFLHPDRGPLFCLRHPRGGYWA